MPFYVIMLLLLYKNTGLPYPKWLKMDTWVYKNLKLMCGIAGSINYSLNIPLLTKDLFHRGPDEQTTFAEDESYTPSSPAGDPRYCRWKAADAF